MPRLAALDGGTYYHQRTLHEPPFGDFFDATIYVRDAPQANLEQYDLLFVPCRLNANLLLPMADRLAAFVAGGGTLVAMGETFPERWLTGIEATPVETNFWWWLEPGGDLGVRLTGAGDLDRYLDNAALTWHLHGFYTLRPGQVALVEANGACVMFEERRGRGRLIVTSLDPCYHHGSYFMPATTRFLEGFLPWLNTSVVGAAARPAGGARIPASNQGPVDRVRASDRPGFHRGAAESDVRNNPTSGSTP